jgi:hypothetical protein
MMTDQELEILTRVQILVLGSSGLLSIPKLVQLDQKLNLTGTLAFDLPGTSPRPCD